ncbi:PASTA domain-containing protein [Polymorphospora sp. NPDC050346]|uniref:PASTA domain-containing protein n=1 Tax=Polymorphospora sp. NPDC050346 TaxID=3155780 RepID=UPI0033BFBAC6
MTYQPSNHPAQPGHGQPPHKPNLVYPPPAPPRRKLGTGAVIGIVAGVVVLACCGVTGIAAIVGSSTEPVANPAPATTSAAAAPVAPIVEAPTIAPATTPLATTAPEPTTAAPTTPPTPAKLVMPDLKGLNAAIADDKLRKLGFTNIQYGSQDEYDTMVLLLANWTVTKQSAKAGSELAPDDLIVVTCTKQS